MLGWNRLKTDETSRIDAAAAASVLQVQLEIPRLGMEISTQKLAPKPKTLLPNSETPNPVEPERLKATEFEARRPIPLLPRGAPVSVTTSSARPTAAQAAMRQKPQEQPNPMGTQFIKLS